ncbi:MAG: HmuY family protein [Chitinophagaceae bacterium]
MNKKICLPFLLATVLFSCKKETVSNEQDAQSVFVRDLAGDTSASMQNGAASFKNLYYSFQTNTEVKISDTEKRSAKWDIAFTGPYNSEVYINNGTNPNNPGFEGPGLGAVVVIEKPYNDVTEAPADAVFETAALNKIGWDAGNGRGWFYYSLDNHIMVPVKNRTFVLRTATGKYAKLELINAYKGNPPVVTDLFWPAPYFTFRYFVQEDGGRDLRTGS